MVSSHNPLGKIFTPQELQTLGTFCVAHSLVLLSDEVYEHLCYNKTFSRPAALDPAIAAHTLTVGSIGKLFNATGWRVGYILGPEQLIKPVIAAHTLLAHTTAGPAQQAAAKGLRLAEENCFWEENRRDMERRQTRFIDVLDALGLPVSANNIASQHPRVLKLPRYLIPHPLTFIVLQASERLLRLRKHPQDPSSSRLRFPSARLRTLSRREASLFPCPRVRRHLHPRQRYVCFMSPALQGCSVVIYSTEANWQAAFYHGENAALGDDFLRFIVCKTDPEIDLAKERLLGLKSFIAHV